MWSKLENKPYVDFGMRLDSDSMTMIPHGSDLSNSLLLLKLISTHRVLFEKAVSALIVFNEVIFLLIQFWSMLISGSLGSE